MPAPVSHSHHQTNIYDMMEHLGIEVGGGVVSRLGLSYATAFHRCEACTCKQACRAWMDSAPPLVPFAPRFCPSADILFELQLESPGHGPVGPGDSFKLSSTG